MDEGRVYIYERGIAFSAPAAWVEALASLIGPAPTPQPGQGPSGRPTEAPALPPKFQY